MNHRTKYRLFGIPLSWLVLIVFDAGLVLMVMGQEKRQALPPAVVDQPAEVNQIEGADNISPEEVCFAAIDVIVDSGATPLAAYQLEMRSRTPGVEIVGIERSEHSAFAEPPHYDPRAMNNNRVILAAFSTAEDLPSGRSRVARVHLQLQGPERLVFETRLDVSATRDHETISASLSLTKATL